MKKESRGKTMHHSACARAASARISHQGIAMLRNSIMA
jgi:hypothetical protein